MKGKPVGYRLSPNEEARLLKAAREQCRIERQVQVREQSKLNAAKIRQAVKDEKNRQIQKLANQLQEEFEEEKQEKLKTLEELYSRTINSLGEGHTSAVNQEPEEEKRAILAEVDQQRAEIRHQRALKKLREDKSRKEEQENRPIAARQAALEFERERAAEVAAQPKPPPDPINDIEPLQVRAIKFTDLDAFSTTHLHIPEVCHVEKAQAEEQIDARASAKEETDKVEDITLEKTRVVHERREKARLRYKHALQKEVLKNEYQDMLHDLSDLQRSDKQRRQHVVAKIPKQIFLPPHRRVEEKEESQRDMEQAFEEMYMARTEYMGDLSLALDPHPPPATPSATESLDLSLADPDAEVAGVTDRATGQDQGASEVTPRDATKTPQPALAAHAKTPEGLRQLLSRIKKQRKQWAHKPAGAPRGVGADQHTGVHRQGVPSLSQHSLTSADVGTTETETETLSTGEVMSTGQTETTLYSQSLGPDADAAQAEAYRRPLAGVRGVVGAVNGTLSEGTLTPSVVDQASQEQESAQPNADHTLLHPLEKAAHARQRLPTPLDLSSCLEAERRRQEQLRQNTAQLERETQETQQFVLEQKAELERRLADIEAQRTRLQMKIMESQSDLSSEISSQHESQIVDPPVVGPFQGERRVDYQQQSQQHFEVPSEVQDGSVRMYTAQPLDEYQDTSYQSDSARVNMPAASLNYGASGPTMMHQVAQPSYQMPPKPYQNLEASSEGQSIDARINQVREYQRELLERQKHQFEQLSQTRQEMAERADQLLQPQAFGVMQQQKHSLMPTRDALSLPSYPLGISGQVQPHQPSYSIPAAVPQGYPVIQPHDVSMQSHGSSAMGYDPTHQIAPDLVSITPPDSMSQPLDVSSSREQKFMPLTPQQSLSQSSDSYQASQAGFSYHQRDASLQSYPPMQPDNYTHQQQPNYSRTQPTDYMQQQQTYPTPHHVSHQQDQDLSQYTDMSGVSQEQMMPLQTPANPDPRFGVRWPLHPGLSGLGYFKDVSSSASMGNASSLGRTNSETPSGLTPYEAGLPRSLPTSQFLETRLAALEQRMKDGQLDIAPVPPKPQTHNGDNSLGSEQASLKVQQEALDEETKLLGDQGTTRNEEVQAVKGQWMREFLKSKMESAGNGDSKPQQKSGRLHDSGLGTLGTLPAIEESMGATGGYMKTADQGRVGQGKLATQEGMNMKGPGTRHLSYVEDQGEEEAEPAVESLPHLPGIRSSVDMESGFHPKSSGITIEKDTEESMTRDKNTSEVSSGSEGAQAIKSGRSWHEELARFSGANNSELGKSSVANEPEPLVFEIQGPDSPLILRRKVGNDSRDASLRLSSIPYKGGKKDEQGFSQKKQEGKVADISVDSANMSQQTLGDHETWMRSMPMQSGKNDDMDQLFEEQPEPFAEYKFRQTDDFKVLSPDAASGSHSDRKSGGLEDSGANLMSSGSKLLENLRSTASELTQYPLTGSSLHSMQHRLVGEQTGELTQYPLTSSGSKLSESLRSTASELTQYPLTGSSLHSTQHRLVGEQTGELTQYPLTGSSLHSTQHRLVGEQTGELTQYPLTGSSLHSTQHRLVGEQTGELTQYPLTGSSLHSTQHRLVGEQTGELTQYSIGSRDSWPSEAIRSQNETQPPFETVSELEQFPLTENSDENSPKDDGKMSMVELTGEASLKEPSTRKTIDSDKLKDTIAKQVEESLQRHRNLMLQTQQMLNFDSDQRSSQKSSSKSSLGSSGGFLTYSEQSKLSFKEIPEETGILDEPDITLLSLNSSCDSPGSNTAPSRSKSLRSPPGARSFGPLEPIPTGYHQASMDPSLVYSPPKESTDSQDVSFKPQCLWFDAAEEPSFVVERSAIGDNIVPVSPNGARQFSQKSPSRPMELGMEQPTEEEGFSAMTVEHIEGSSSDDVQGLSLQDAFLRKKKGFLKSADRRKAEATKEVKSVTKPHHQGSLGKTLASWKKSRAMNAGASSQQGDPTNIVERTSADRKRATGDMKTRTARLYNKLGEVRQQKEVEDRKKSYAANRERAKEFQMKYQADLKKKQDKKK